MAKDLKEQRFQLPDLLARDVVVHFEEREVRPVGLLSPVAAKAAIDAPPFAESRDADIADLPPVTAALSVQHVEPSGVAGNAVNVLLRTVALPPLYDPQWGLLGHSLPSFFLRL